MRSRNPEHSPTRDERYAPAGDDKFARESNTFRRMQPWQIWALAIAAAVLVVLGVIYV